MTHRRRLLVAAALAGFGLLSIGFFGIVAAAGAEESSDRTPGTSQPSTAAADDLQRLLLLAPGRPLRIDLLIYVDGQPLQRTWRERFDRVLTEEDREKSGSLDLVRASRVCEMMSGEFGLKQSRSRIAGALQALAGKNARVDQAPLLDFVERTFPPFAVGSGGPSGTVAASALFGLLDHNRDGRLSRAELEQSAGRLMARDFDDDQLISERELVVDPTLPVERGAAPAAEAVNDMVLVLVPGVDATAIAESVVKHYDQDGDGRLAIRGATAELIVSAEMTAALDANGNGALDAGEVAAVIQQTADVTLPLDFGAGGKKRLPAHTVSRPSDELRVRRKVYDGGYKLYVGDAEVEINRNSSSPTQSGGSLLRFAAFDKDQNSYLDAMEVKASPILAASFQSMDADGDGKVTPGEFQVYVDAQSAAAGTRIRLKVVDRGQDLFSLLDANGDGLLTPRELQSATSLINSNDRNGDGVLSGIEIPHRLSLDLARETLPVPGARPATPRIRANQLTGSDAGPVWFRKMDRNRDGDLSSGEFLGSAADFAAADTNRDGLVDAEEAEAFSKERGVK